MFQTLPLGPCRGAGKEAMGKASDTHPVIDIVIPPNVKIIGLIFSGAED